MWFYRFVVREKIDFEFGARVERSRVACAGVYAVPALAGWGRVYVGDALQGF